MRTEDFDFDLPAALIAQTPAEPRDSSRLMVLDVPGRTILHQHFRDLAEFLRAGDVMVVNDTRVMAARLFGTRPDTGGRVEALLLRPLTDRQWEVLFRPARAAVPGRAFLFETGDGAVPATVLARGEGAVTIEFARSIDPATAGSVPLPPYIKGYAGDPERYQTVYNREPRSAAAPTAGLHFTPGLLDQIRATGVIVVPVTLEVGPGTFKPVAVDDPRDHQLHAEQYAISPETADAINSAKAEGRRVVAIGTTVVRTLEHAARENGGAIAASSGWTQLRILPGDRFLVIDALVTNFHLPRSTLLMLVSAFAGQELVMGAYRLAVAQGYRFYSFGDAMLLFP